MEKKFGNEKNCHWTISCYDGTGLIEGQAPGKAGYPETGDHVRDAIAAGHSDVCTIELNGAEECREESLAGIPTKTGYDRDEWPMAMCEEGVAGASVRYVTPSDNRGAGAWVGNQFEDYPDGTRVLFITD